jgi:hypothetical protein
MRHSLIEIRISIANHNTLEVNGLHARLFQEFILLVDSRRIHGYVTSLFKNKLSDQFLYNATDSVRLSSHVKATSREFSKSRKEDCHESSYISSSFFSCAYSLSVISITKSNAYLQDKRRSSYSLVMAYQ